MQILEYGRLGCVLTGCVVLGFGVGVLGGGGGGAFALCMLLNKAEKPDDFSRNVVNNQLS